MDSGTEMIELYTCSSLVMMHKNMQMVLDARSYQINLSIFYGVLQDKKSSRWMYVG